MTPSELEQGLSNMRDTLPRMWWALYQGSMATGFDALQSFVLVQTHILSTNPRGITPPMAGGPESDTPS